MSNIEERQEPSKSGQFTKKAWNRFKDNTGITTAGYAASNLKNRLEKMKQLNNERIAAKNQGVSFSDFAKQKASEGAKAAWNNAQANPLVAMPKEALNNIKSKAASVANGAQNLANAYKEGGMKGLKDAGKASVKAGLSSAKESIAEGLKGFTEQTKNNFKQGAVAAGQAMLGPSGQTMAQVGTALASGNLAGAAIKIGTDTLKEFATNPEAAFKKIMTLIACCCAPFFLIIGAIMAMISVIAMFFGILTNDSAKSDGMRAQESWVYKMTEADEEVKAMAESKLRSKGHLTYRISHNAAKQQEIEDKNKDKPQAEREYLDENGQEMKDSEGYIDIPIYVYESASLSSNKSTTTFKYGDAVVVHIPEGKSDPLVDGEFTAIEFLAKDAKTLDFFQNLPESNNGLTNENEKEMEKVIVYMESRLLYKTFVPDPNMEYTIQDEYDLASIALRKLIEKRKDEETKKGNAIIDSEAGKYTPASAFENYVDSPKYSRVKAAVVKDGDTVVKSLSPVENPNQEIYDAEKSRSILNASVANKDVTNIQVAQILSGYAAAKADTIPDKGYYKMLDSTMIQHLGTSLKLSDHRLLSNAGTRSLPTRMVKEMDLVTMESPNEKFQGIIVLHSTYPDLEGTRISLMEKRDYYVHPESPAKAQKDGKTPAKADGYYFEEDLNIVPTSSNLYKVNPEGPYKIVKVDDLKKVSTNRYLDQLNSQHNHIIVAKVSKSKIVDDEVSTQSYNHDIKYSSLMVSPLDSRKIVWQFFKNSEYYPYANRNAETEDAKGNVVNIGAIPETQWANKLKLVRSLAFYPARLSYVFNNTRLDEKGEYFWEKNPFYGLFPGEKEWRYFKIVSGAPKNTDETLTEKEFYEQVSGEEFKEGAAKDLLSGINLNVVDGKVQNYRKMMIEDYSSTTTINLAGVEAEKNKFLWIIPTNYKQEYRRSALPEEINKVRLDPKTGEYKKQFKTKSVSMGISAEPVENWESKITSPHGERFDPFTGERVIHHGVDIADAKNTPIYAIADATVTLVESSNFGCGNSLGMVDKNGAFILYCHSESVLVEEGDEVLAGQHVTNMGTTGYSTGDHLHLEIHPNGRGTGSVDPVPLLKEIVASTVVNQGAATEGDSGEEKDWQEEYDPNDKEIMTVGHKMDYWFDNIMTTLSFDDTDLGGTSGEDVVALAMQYVGKEAGGLRFKSDFLGKTVTDKRSDDAGFPWCAVFVSVIMKDAGYPGFKGTDNGTALAPWSASVRDFKTWAEGKGQLHDANGQYQPKPGDLAIFDWDKDGIYDHLGFVASSQGQKFTLVDGNTAGPGDTSPEGIWWGVVNSSEYSFTSSNYNAKFIEIKYPEKGSTESILIKYLGKMTNSNYSSVDQFGRLGVLRLLGDDAIKLINDIAKTSPEEYKAIKAKMSDSTLLDKWLNGEAKKIEGELKTALTSILKLKSSETIQNQRIKDAIKVAEEKGKKTFGDDKWYAFEPKVQLYLITQEIIFSGYSADGFISNSKVVDIMNAWVDKKGDYNSLLGNMEEFKKSINGSIFNDNDIRLLVDMKTVFDNVGRIIKGIPESQLNMGMGNGKTWNLPPGIGRVKSFMGNHMVTAPSSYQYKLKKYTTTGPHGIGMIDGRMTVAMYVGAKGSPKGYGEVGDKIDILLSTGQILKVIIADAKALESDYANYAVHNGLTLEQAKKYGVHNDGSVVEFVLNTQTTGGYPSKWPQFTNIFPGEVRKVVNLGPSGK